MRCQCRRSQTVFFAVCLFALAASRADGVDYWVSPGDPAVATNNDCGHVTEVSGSPTIRRSFHEKGHAGVAVNVADRLSSGDELEAPAGSRLEWATGFNTVVTLAPGTRVRLDGLRSFSDASGTTVERLDVTLLAGELRAQVRLNVERPESLLVAANGAEVLVTRGDAAVFSGDAWRATALAEGAAARARRGGVLGAPFPIEPGQTAGLGVQEAVEAADLKDIRARLPFSFELARLALPPLPPMSSVVEAP